MRISENHIDHIVRHCLDEDFKKGLLQCRELIIKTFDSVKDDTEFVKYDNLELDNHTNIDVMTISDNESSDHLQESISDFMERELPNDIIMNSPNLKRLLLKLRVVDADALIDELCSISIDCIDKELIYANKSTINSVKQLFIDARHDLIIVKKTANDVIMHEKKNKSIFGKKKRMNIITSVNSLIDLLDVTINDLNDVLDTLNEVTELFFDLVSDLFYKLNSEGFSKILK